MKRRLIAIFLIMVMALAMPTAAFSKEKTTSKYSGPAPNLSNAINQQAILCSWPYGTKASTYKYSSGKPTDAYKKALDTAYPNRSRWGKKPRAGASCDVFVGTVIRSCGYDKNFPRGLAEDLTYLPKSKKFTKVNVYKAKDLEPGDVILCLYKGGGGHISIYVEHGGVGYIANAHYMEKGGCYGVRDRKAKDFNPSSYKSFGVYRPNSKCTAAITRGESSDSVENLQNFLNWRGYKCGKADGIFGENTEKGLIKFQEAENLEADGKFGRASYSAAQKYTNWGDLNENGIAGASKPLPNKPAEDKPDTTVSKVKYYTGNYPEKTVKYKSGTKKDIKRWQSYLKWYGYKISVDGQFGKQTRTITKKFQKSNGLKDDGVVGKLTIKKAKTIKR